MSKFQMLTYTGKLINPLELKQEDICLEDIAWSLSKQCRYNGHCKRFYSVLEHSVYLYYVIKEMGEQLVDHEEYLKYFLTQALLHDAVECYLGDMISPIKALLIDKYGFSIKEIEDTITEKIFTKYKINYPIYNSVDAGDKEIRKVEMFKLGMLHEDLEYETVIPKLAINLFYNEENTQQFHINEFMGLCRLLEIKD